MGILEWPRQIWDRITGKGGTLKGVLSTTLPTNPIDAYDLLEAYYDNNDLYAKLASSSLGPGRKTRALENPAHDIVEFYASHLWPESLSELPLASQSQPLIRAARQVLEWGNWGYQKQVAARWLPMYGDLYMKAESVEDSDRAYPKLIDPRYVTEFKKDERGFAIRVRLDIRIEKDGGHKTRTELYDKKENRFAVWEHEKGPAAKIEDLGTPLTDEPLTRGRGVDFVPFAHAPFQGTGKDRGVGAFTHALEPINELNKMASRTNDMLFRHGKPLWLLLRNESGMGAVSLEDLTRTEDSTEVELGEGDEKEKMLNAPGMSTLASLIPNIPYSDALGLMQDRREVLQRTCPELLYYVIQQIGDPSGVALALKLAPAQDRAKEARTNGETAVLQVIQMCLTIAQAKGAFSEDIGTFEQRSDLAFEVRQILPTSDLEKAQAEKAQLEVLELRQRILGEPLSALRREFGVEDVQPIGPDDAVVEPRVNEDAATRIAAQLASANGR